MTTYSEVENALLVKIKTRGYWNLIFRPTPFRRRTNDVGLLPGLVQQWSIQLRGGRFPFAVKPGEPSDDVRQNITLDWAGQTFEWDHHLEVWRYYASGQFSYFLGVPWDWRDQSDWWPSSQTPNWSPNSVIGIGQIARTCIEAFEFCVQMAQSDMSDEQVRIELTLGNTHGRRLISDSPHRMLRPAYQASSDAIPYVLDVSRTELLATVGDLESRAMCHFFRAFGFDAAPSVAESLLAEVRRG